MASSAAPPDARPDKSVQKFLANPHAYEFVQAIRILARRLDPGTPGRGGRFDAAHEPVRVATHTSYSFPASDIHEVVVPDGEDSVPEMRITMLGLTGVAGPLPQYYTQLLLEQKAAGERSLDDFLNIFNHRLAYLYYYAWEKYRFPAAFERTGADPLQEILLSLAGVPPAPLPAPGGLPRGFFARFAALLALQPRSGQALQTILADYFEVPVDVVQYAGAWYRLEGASLTRMDEKDSMSDRLGYGVVAGEDYWSLDSMVRIRIGPVPRPLFEKFLPKPQSPPWKAKGTADAASGVPEAAAADSGVGEWHSTLREICRFFARDEFAFEIQLVLDRKDVPACELNPAAGLQLGWTTWMKSRPFKMDPDDVVFRL